VKVVGTLIPDKSTEVYSRKSNIVDMKEFYQYLGDNSERFDILVSTGDKYKTLDIIFETMDNTSIVLQQYPETETVYFKASDENSYILDNRSIMHYPISKDKSISEIHLKLSIAIFEYLNASDSIT
jgi:hypothetical protein